MGGSMKKEIALLRSVNYARMADQMEQQDENGGEDTADGKFKKKKAAKQGDNDTLVMVVRGVVLAAAIGLTVYGLLYNGAMDVLWKAVNICQECIGLG